MSRSEVHIHEVRWHCDRCGTQVSQPVNNLPLPLHTDMVPEGWTVVDVTEYDAEKYKVKDVFHSDFCVLCTEAFNKFTRCE